MRGESDGNIRFYDACTLMPHLGYEHRRGGGGSHRVFVKQGCPFINLQNDNGKVKRYQVQQMRQQFEQQSL